MTIGAYITEKLSTWSVTLSEAVISLELERVGLTASEDISGEINLDRFFYNVIPDILLMPSSISEGGFSIAYDKNAMMAYYGLVAKRLGYQNMLGGNTVTDITNRW